MPIARRDALAGIGASILGGSAGTAFADDAIKHEFARGDGLRLRVARTGQGKLVLFLHGAPDDWTLYRPLMQDFARDHLAAAPNLRGYPPSDAPMAVEAYAMPRLLGDVHALLDHFGRERCTLVGNDWGGYIAWVFAAAYPDRVERAVIVNAPHPAIHLREVRTNPAQITASAYERDLQATPAPYPAWHNYYRADPIKVAESVAAAAATAPPDLAGAFFAGLKRRPAATDLRVRVPVLVIWGMRDPYLLPSQLDGMEAYAPDLTIRRIDDAGHLPMRSHPEIVRDAMRAFLRR